MATKKSSTKKPAGRKPAAKKPATKKSSSTTSKKPNRALVQVDASGKITKVIAAYRE